MEQDYLHIRELLSQIEGLSTIDEDTGQLEAMLNGEDTYPITFPAALILFNDIDWKSFMGTDTQRGTGTFTIRLAFDCYDDTYQGAEQDSYALHRQSLIRAVHQAIHRECSPSSHNGYLRTHTRSLSLPGRIKVYEQDYSFTIEE